MLIISSGLNIVPSRSKHLDYFPYKYLVTFGSLSAALSIASKILTSFLDLINLANMFKFSYSPAVIHIKLVVNLGESPFFY